MTDDYEAEARAKALAEIEQVRADAEARTVARLTATTDQMSCLHLLGVLGEPNGLKPGSFTTPLIHAALAADRRNRARLASAFPEIVAAVTLWKDHDKGWAIVHRVAAGGQGQ